MTKKTRAAFDEHMGAVETERPTDPPDTDSNALALDEEGLPEDHDRICEDVIGANEDGTEG